MSAASHRKRPLVLGARARALSEARRLGVARPLENLVEEAIAAGHLGGANVGEESPVYIGHGLMVVCEKVRIASGRRAWRPLTVQREPRRAA